MHRTLPLVVLGLLVVLAWPAAQAQNDAGGKPPPAGPGHDPARRDGVSGSKLRPTLGIRIDLNKLFAPTRTEPTHEPGQLLVLWPDETEARAGLAWLAQNEQLVAAEQHGLPALGGVLALFVLTDDTQARLLRERIRAAQPQWVVDLNARATPQQHDSAGAAAPKPATAPRLYAHAMLGLTPAVPRPPALRVGVIDTELDPGWLQPSAARLWNGSTVQLRSLLAADDTAAPPTHGQQVAMLLAGVALANGFAGAAPAVELRWAAVMRRTGASIHTDSLRLARALDWLVGQQVQLVNLSAGGAGDDILRTVVGQVLARGVALLAAAGNQPTENAVYPAAYAGVWAVTAVDAQAQAYAQASRARHVAFAAPGVDVWVPDAVGVPGATASSNDSTMASPAGRYVSGTSFATALASGALARLPASFWQLAPMERKARLCEAARPGAPPQAVLGCGLLRFDAIARNQESRP